MTVNAYFTDGVNFTETAYAATQKSIVQADGYCSGAGSELAVIQHTPADMIVIVGTGDCWIQGCRIQNTAALDVAITAAHATLDRIDRIIVRITWATNVAEIVTLDGTAAASPTAPALTQSGAVYELSLAQVAVAALATSVVTANITDERLTAYCGVAATRIGKMHIETDGSLDAASLQIHSVLDPTSDQDAATKKYIADNFAALAGPTFTGVPKSTTAAYGTNTTQIATTAFVKAAVDSVWTAYDPTWTFTTATPASPTKTGRYVKIGKTVIFNCSYTSADSNAGVLTAISLPVAAGASAATTAVKFLFKASATSGRLGWGTITAAGTTIVFTDVYQPDDGVAVSYYVSAVYEVD